MSLTIHETYMQRCIQLALLGAGHVAPNPMVGAVLVHNDRIIGEGYHQEYGGAHAEVNCIANVDEKNKRLIRLSTMYVSLEPCAHFGKTPPCADFIIKHKIPHVVIGCRDPFEQVNGKGTEKLKAAGIDITTGILEKDCMHLNRRFFTFHTQHRPYIIIKWAETRDRRIGNYGNNRLHITNAITNRLVHKWRNDEAAIMVGTNTAAFDDPQLTNRLWSGKSPVRIILDTDLRLSSSLKIFDRSVPTIIFNTRVHEENGSLIYYQITDDVSVVHQVLNGLYQKKINSVMIEGGTKLIQSFIDEGTWDEARVITNNSLEAGDGVPSPVLTNEKLVRKEIIGDDVIQYYYAGR
jgi:diaminohydroxyphosphoribosylaminopyrimidine deaminase/5-amino-6-(5-phosphoribosylamino)uracil reductase